MNKIKLLKFIAKQKTAFISSIDEEGYPIIRAMLAPRIIEENDIYFSTNTSSCKVKQYLNNNKACVYFYKRGLFKYQGVTIKGTMQVCTDLKNKQKVWKSLDKIFYKDGINDIDYCVLKFTAIEAKYYKDFKIENIKFE